MIDYWHNLQFFIFSPIPILNDDETSSPPFTTLFPCHHLLDRPPSVDLMAGLDVGTKYLILSLLLTNNVFLLVVSETQYPLLYS